MSTGAFVFSLKPTYGMDPKDNRSAYNASIDLSKDARVEWCERAYEEAMYENSQSEELASITRYIDYIAGNQWKKGRPSYKSKPTDNRVWRLFWEMVALLTDIRPSFTVKALDKSFHEQADIINKVTRAWWLYSESDLSLAMCVIYSILCTGFGKLCWNKRLRNGEGDFELVPISPTDLLYLKPRGYDARDAQAVIYKTIQPLGWFTQKYGQLGAMVQPDLEFSRYSMPGKLPSNMSQSQFQNLSPALQRRFAGAPDSKMCAYPMALHREFWVEDWTPNETGSAVYMGPWMQDSGQRMVPLATWSYIVQPNEPLYPRKRLICLGGSPGASIVMYDGPNPYWHGEYPFAPLRMNIVPWQFHGMCYSSDTEVLTRRGWIKFADAREDDEFATRQTGTGKFEWQNAEYFTNEPYKGKMYNFKSRSMDICVTPEHRMLVNGLPRGLGGNRYRKGETVIKAFELAKYGNHHTMIPQTSTWDGEEIGTQEFSTGSTGHGNREKPIRMTGDEYCAFMGAYLSEGWCHQSCGVYVSQFATSKGYGPFKYLLSKILGTTVPYNGKDFCIPRTGLTQFCRKFGKSHEKYIPEDIMNATPRQIRIFWKHYVLGDGSLKKRVNKTTKIRESEEYAQKISTVSPRMADQLQELAQKIGWSASVTKKAGVDRVFPGSTKLSKARTQYELIVRYSKATSVKAAEFDYDGTIHCVTVPNGIIYTRRNGKPTWCGNSELKPLCDLQDIINGILAGVMDMVKRAVNPGFVAPKNALSDTQWNMMDWSMPGQKVAYNIAGGGQPQFAPQPQLPAFVMNVMQLAAREQDYSSGIATINNALQHKQVPSADTIEQAREAQQTPFRLKGRNIEIFLRRFGQQTVSNVFQFYNAERRMFLLGRDGLTNEDFDYSPATMVPDQADPLQHSKKFAFIIEQGSLLNVSKVEQASLYLNLRKMGDISRETLLTQLDVGIDPQKETAALNEEKKQALQQAIQARAVTQGVLPPSAVAGGGAS